MSRLPVLETAFSGYRLLAAKPEVALIWFALHLVGGLIGTAMDVLLADAPDVLDGLVSFAFVVGLLTFSVGAATRAGLGSDRDGWGYLGLGKDEARLAVTTSAMLLIFFVVVVVAMVAWNFAVLLWPGGEGEIPVWNSLPAVATAAPGVALFLFIAVRLSLAPARTVAEGAIRIFSWRVTQGNVWRLLAAYGLAILPAILIAVVSFFGAQLMTGYRFGDEIDLSAPNYTTMGEAFALEPLIWCVYGAIVEGLVIAVLAVPAAVAYARLGAAVPVEDIFGD